MRLSRRLPESQEPNALHRALEARRRTGPGILDLTLSNPTAAGFAPWPGLAAALGGPGVERYAPDPLGDVRAREAVAAFHGQGVRPGDLVLAASTSEAYAWLFKAVADPGDEVLVPSPSYPLFEWLARLEGMAARPVAAAFHEGWQLDIHALEAACGPRTKALVVVNPNNPTGQYLSPAEWEGLTALCAARGLLLIVDEVFATFPLERPAERLATVLSDPAPPCPVAVLSGLSKAALLPQVKLGWMVLRGPGSEALGEAVAFLADQFLSVSASAQAAAPAILAASEDLRAPLLARCRANLAALDAALLAHPHLARLRVEGGWSVLLRRPALEPDEACAVRLLEAAGVLVHPGHFFDIPKEGFLVLSLLVREADFAEGLARLLPRLAP
jgi:hypothetical protein